MTLPDYSAWLTPARLAEEERQWTDAATRTWPVFVEWIQRVALTEWDVRTIIEFGCGTGLVPAALPPQVHYLGIDAHPHCIARAQRRNPGPARGFGVFDARDPDIPGGFDLACAFSFFKHFGLDEWDRIVIGVLRRGQYGLFSMRIGQEVLDDGTEFPHVQVSVARLDAAIQAAGHRRVEHPGLLPWGECMIITRRC